MGKLDKIKQESRYRKAIRESLKKLITEQPIPQPKTVLVSNCDPNSTNTPNGTPGQQWITSDTMNMLVDDNGVIREPVVGDIFTGTSGGPGTVQMTYIAVQVGTASPNNPQYTWPITTCTNTSGNYSPGVEVTFKTCLDMNTPSYYTFCMPDSGYPFGPTAPPQIGQTYVNTNTVNSPIEGVKGFVMNIGGTCNSIQNGQQWTTMTVPVGNCPACCDAGQPLIFSPMHTSIWDMLGFPAQGACTQACPGTGGTTSGCTDPQAINFDPNAIGCPDAAGNPDPTDMSCCDYPIGQDDWYCSVSPCQVPPCPTTCVSVPQGSPPPQGANNTVPYPDQQTCLNQCTPVLSLVPGCTDNTAVNYDANADGCPDAAGNPDPTDMSCCDYFTMGCADSNAMNFDPSATGCDFANPSDTTCCDYGWNCKPGWKPGIGGKCVKGTTNNPGQFGTKQDCISSGCEPLPADVDIEKGIASPGGPFSGITPVTGLEPMDTMDIRERFQKLANIK